MSKRRLLLTADTHAQTSAWTTAPHHLVAGDAAWGLEQIARLAIKHEVAAVIAAGDLIDKQRNRSAPVQMLLHCVLALRRAGIDFFFVQGQHDLDDPPWLDGVEGAFHLDCGRTVHEHGWRLHGFDFQPAGRLQERLDAVPADTDILVCHQTWSEWMGDITQPQGALAEVRHVGLVLAGDLHKWKCRAYEHKTGKALCVSPGATCMQAINEPQEHFVALLEADGTVGKVPLASRVVVDAGIVGTAGDVDELLGRLDGMALEARQTWLTRRLPEALARPILKVEFGPAAGDCRHRVERQAGERFHLFFSERVPSVEEAAASRQVPKPRKGAAVTPRSMLDHAIDPEKYPGRHALAARLLDADDPAAEFAKYRSEVLDAEEADEG